MKKSWVDEFAKEAFYAKQDVLNFFLSSDFIKKYDMSTAIFGLVAAAAESVFIVKKMEIGINAYALFQQVYSDLEAKHAN